MRLRVRLGAVFAVIFLVAILISGASLLSARASVQDAYTQGAVTLAQKNLVDELSRIEKRAIDVEGEARTGFIIDAVTASNTEYAAMDDRDRFIDRQDRAWQESNTSTFIEARTDSELAEDIRHWAELHTDDPLFAEAILTNRYGAVVAATGKTTDFRQDDEEWWQAAWEDGTYIGTVQYDLSAQVTSIRIATPVYDMSGGKIGVMAAIYDIRDIQDALDRIEQVAGIPVTVWMAASDGTLAYGTDSRVERSVLEDVSSAPWYQQMTGDRGSFRLKTDRGPELFAYARSQEGFSEDLQGWSVIIAYPLKQLFGPVHDVEAVFFGFAAVLLFTIVGAGFYLYRSVRDPVETLTDVITSISHGELNTVINERLLGRRDEFGELARAFNRTLTSLKLAMAKIPDRPQPFKSHEDQDDAHDEAV